MQTVSPPPFIGLENEKFKTIGPETNLLVDLQTPQIPDAMNRIRQRNAEKKKEKLELKKKMVNQMEKSRVQILESYNIKTML